VPGISHAFFTRQGGVSTGIYAALNTGTGSQDDRACVLENRARAAAYLRVSPDRLVTPYQVHGDTALVVAEPWAPGMGPKADALVTACPGLAIGIGTADCGPVLFADATARVVGAAHAGWKGALDGILESTIAAMESVGAERGRIIAVLGPTISAAAYEVGPEFRDRFTETDTDNWRFFAPSPRDDHAHFDLPAYIVARLGRAGIASAQNLGLCTYTDEARFFSFRRATHRGEPDYGRLLAAITIHIAGDEA
jgi:YfiH family protein